MRRATLGMDDRKREHRQGVSSGLLFVGLAIALVGIQIYSTSMVRNWRAVGLILSGFGIGLFVVTVVVHTRDPS
jgi:hypothetical protein